MLTLPTSILYLAPAALLGWHCWRKRPFPCQPLKIVLAAGVVLTAGWYLLNYHALRGGTGVGNARHRRGTVPDAGLRTPSCI